MSDEILQLSWAEFQSKFKWKQGEHVALIGPTGCGKTTLAHHLLPMRKYVVVLATKPKDKTMSELVRDGYTKTIEWPAGPTDIVQRVVLWPSIDSRDKKLNQKWVFHDALDDIYRSGSWTIFADELSYLINTLGLQATFQDLWQQGRSIGISVIAGAQRPSHVPLLLYSQSTHLFMWRQTDDRDLKRIGGIGSLNSRLIQDIVSHLPGPTSAGWPKKEAYSFLYINTRNEQMVVSRAEL